MSTNENPVIRLLHRDPVDNRAKAPEPCLLTGRWARLEPLDPPAQAGALFDHGHDTPAARALWEYLSYGPFADRQAMEAWMTGLAGSSDPRFFCIRDEAGVPAGMASYLRINPGQGSIEIGHIWMAPRLQRTRAATEALYLMIRHAFEALGYRRLEWKCNAVNEASRQAARRLGFSYEGTFYRCQIVKGLNRDTAWYAMLEEDWARNAPVFEAWLRPENFDAEGRQLRPLGIAAPA